MSPQCTRQTVRQQQTPTETHPRHASAPSMTVGCGLVGRRTAGSTATSQAPQPPHGGLQGAVRLEINSTRAGTVRGLAGAPGSSGPCPDPGPRVSRCIVCFQAFSVCVFECMFRSSIGALFAAPKWWPRAWRSG